MICPQNLKVAESVAHTQLVICLQLTSVACPADTLKVFTAVRIPCPQSPDKPCWYDVIHMPLRACLPKIYAAKLHFAISPQSRDAVTPPASPTWGCTGPRTVNACPTNWLFLCPKFSLTKLAPTVAVCFAAKELSFEDFGLAILAVGTTHG